MSIWGGSLSGQAHLEDDGQIKLHDASMDLSSFTIAASGELSGFGIVANAIENLGIIDARDGKMDLGGAITGSGQFQISKAATFELGGATAEAVIFVSNHGTLHLDKAGDFTGTIAGMAKGRHCRFGRLRILVTSGHHKCQWNRGCWQYHGCHNY